MTLNTEVRIVGHVDVEGLHALCNDLVEYPADAPRPTPEPDPYAAQGWVRAVNACGVGAKAWLFFSVHPNGDGPRDTPEVVAETLADGFDPGPECSVCINFDTTYGYRGPGGEGCSELHRRISARIGEYAVLCGADWWGHDEFTGEWHHRTPVPASG